MIPCIDLLARVQKLPADQVITLDEQHRTSSDHDFTVWADQAWPRLKAERASPNFTFTWSLKLKKALRRADAVPNSSGALAVLEVVLTGQLDCYCQRCNQPVTIEIDEAREIYLTETDSAAERLAHVVDDVLVLEKQFDLAAFLEEEILLALPLLILHDECDEQALAALQATWQGLNHAGASATQQSTAQQAKGLKSPNQAAQSSDKPNPFAVLAALKKS